MCLETLLMQPGINTENVIVCIEVFVYIVRTKNAINIQVAVDEKFAEALALINLFGFKGEKTSNSSTYMGKIKH